MKIASEIKEIRNKLGITQAELAKKINSNRFNIANYETNRAVPPATIYIKIKNLLHKFNDMTV